MDTSNIGIALNLTSKKEHLYNVNHSEANNM